MGEDQKADPAAEGEEAPSGLMHFRLDGVLAGSAVALLVASSVVRESEWGFWIVVAFAVVLGIASFVARRQLRKYVRTHGEVELRITYSVDESRSKKCVLHRDVSELIDDAIDRALDGKKQ